MGEIRTPIDRINYTGDIGPLAERIASTYGVGKPEEYSIIDIGYEDCNLVIHTNKGGFLAKIFANSRNPDDINRYADIMRRVVEAGIQHPELMPLGNDIIFTDDKIKLVLMRFIEGKTFFELGRPPADDELGLILEQAAKINSLSYAPPFSKDSWAVQNIEEMFSSVRGFISPDDLPLIERAIASLTAVPAQNLPYCFVHGDLSITNVLKGNDGKIYILDFSVANYYPRIQELAVIVAGLLDDGVTTIADRCGLVVGIYNQFTKVKLTEEEREHLPAYALATIAMNFMGANQEKFIYGSRSTETELRIESARSAMHFAFQ